MPLIGKDHTITSVLRFLSAIWLGKIVFWLTRTFSIGGGSAAPGYYALTLDPDLVKKLAKQIPQQVVITGTNGKTTTARLLANFVKEQNINVLRNATGSNLERGIASALISRSSFLGKIKDIDLGIWELDEAAFNKTVFKIKPDLIVFLNAFRDQLDRYGEVDTIINNWRQSLKKIDWQSAVLLNGGDLSVLGLSKDLKSDYYEFRVKNHQMWQETPKANPLKHKDDLVADKIKNRGLKGVDFTLEFSNQSVPVSLELPGIYHIYDFLAAFGVYYLLNLPIDNIAGLTKGYLPAFGRVEKIKLDKKEAFIFLIKNPAGANQVFETITPELKKGDKLLLALNDNFADGTDVSWIWDADFEQLSAVSHQLSVICSGTRAEELAVRLKYAGVYDKNIEVISDLNKALRKAKAETSGRLFILPTYTALLELQKLLTKMKVKEEYWKE